MKNFLPLLILFFCFSIELHSQCFEEQNYTVSGEYIFTIPGGSGDNYIIEIETIGADGGSFLWGGNPPSAGGTGATMKASFTLSGGDELLVIVGEAGFDAIGSPGGGGGGGGTAVVLNYADVLIAAGAGGGGGQGSIGYGALSNINSVAAGGAGPGASGGGGFQEDGEDGAAGSGGEAGTLIGGGQGGTQGVVAGPGGDGFGGGGGGSGTGGGGGGGYQGGDGAESGDLAGHGGDSYISTLFGGTVITTMSGGNGAGNGSDGSVVLTCIPTTGVNVTLINQSDPACNGDSNGEIEVGVVGGSAPYSWSIDGGPFVSSGLFMGLTSGTYTMTVMDGTGATSSIDVELVDPPVVMIEIDAIVNNDCFGDMEGSIAVSGSGGVGAPFLFAIDGGAPQSSGLFEDLGAGEYTLTTYDANDCSVSIMATVTDQPEIELIVDDVTDASCDEATNGTITASADGGAGGFTYAIDGVTFGVESTFTDLGPGDYTITAMDQTGCVTTIMATVGIAAPFTFLLVDSSDASCTGSADGSLTVVATGGAGGFTYSIDGSTFQSSGTFDELLAASYTVTAMDIAGCTQLLVVSIGAEAGVAINAIVTDNPCQGDAQGTIDISLDSDGEPYTYSWTYDSGNGSGPMDFADTEDITDLGAGTYDLTVTNSTGCTGVASYTLVDPDELIITASATPAMCAGENSGSISVLITGGTPLYMLSYDGIEVTTDADFVIEDLVAGTYTLMVTDENGCTVELSVEVEEPLDMVLMIVDQTDAGCDGDTSGSVTLATENSVGDITYTLDGVLNETGVFVDLASGIYSALATDSNGCTAELSVTIAASTDLEAVIVSQTNVSCSNLSDGSITIEAAGGSGAYTYSLDGGDSQTEPTFEGLPAGSYILEVNDTESCSFLLPFDITEPNPIEIIVNTISASCFGMDDAIVSIQIIGGTSPYFGVVDGDTMEILDNEPIEFDGAEAGDYLLEIFDSNGCVSSTTISVTEPDELLAMVTITEEATCEAPATVELVAVGGTPPYSYEVVDVDPDDPGIQLDPGLYNVVVTDANGCISEISVVIVLEGLEVAALTILNPLCYGDPSGEIYIELENGNEGISFTLDDITNETGVFLDLTAGNYEVLVDDGQGCELVIEVELIEPELLEGMIVSSVPDDGTESGSITVEGLGGTEPYRYSIDGGVTFQLSNEFTGLVNDDYTIIIEDANGCKVELTTVLTDVLELNGILHSFKIFPNPTIDLLNIQYNIASSAAVNVLLYTADSREIYRKDYTSVVGDNLVNIPVERLAAGVYFVCLRMEGSMHWRKVVVQ